MRPHESCVSPAVGDKRFLFIASPSAVNGSRADSGHGYWWVFSSIHRQQWTQAAHFTRRQMTRKTCNIVQRKHVVRVIVWCIGGERVFWTVTLRDLADRLTGCETSEEIDCIGNHIPLSGEFDGFNLSISVTMTWVFDCSISFFKFIYQIILCYSLYINYYRVLLVNLALVATCLIELLYSVSSGASLLCFYFTPRALRC